MKSELGHSLTHVKPPDHSATGSLPRIHTGRRGQCQDWYSACELSQSCSDFMDIADCLEADAGGVVEDCEAQAQLGELSHQLLSASYSSDVGVPTFHSVGGITVQYPAHLYSIAMVPTAIP